MWDSHVFRYFYVSQGLSLVGDGLRSVILPLLVFSLTHSALSVGITYATQTLPLIVTSVFGGYLADHVDRKRLMIISDFGRFATLATLAFLGVAHALNVFALYTAVFVLAILTALFQSCQAPSLAYMLSGRQLTSAVSSLQSAEQVTRIVTYTVAGLAMQALGSVAALAINAVAYLVSQVYLLWIPAVGPAANDSNVFSGESPVRRIFAGFAFVFEHQTLGLFAIVSFGLNATGMMEQVAIIPWLKQLHHATNVEVGWFLAVLSIASVAGFMLASRLSAFPFGKAFTVLIIVHGLVFIPVGIVNNFWVSLAFWCAADLTGSAAASLMISWRIRVTPKDKVGRVVGAIRVLVLIGAVPSALLAGSLAQNSVTEVLLLVALLYLLFGILSVVVPRMRAEAG